MTLYDQISHPFLSAIYDPVIGIVENSFFSEHREYLVKGLKGKVLDLGAGSGALFPYMVNKEQRLELFALEPDPYMRKKSLNKADKLELDIQIVSGRGELIPFQDNTFDYVISSTVLCTVTDLEEVLREIFRVLKPGGELRFLEHVHDDGFTGRFQDLVTPVWKRIVGGCHLNRDTDKVFRSHEFFTVSELELLDLSFVFVKPFIRGVLKPRK